MALAADGDGGGGETPAGGSGVGTFFGGANMAVSQLTTGDVAINQRIDITDLAKLAVPRDLRGFELSAGTGYRDPEKVLREVYNMLLRHLGELREFYKKYRMLLPMPGQDPFVLRLYQFWMLAWDTGLVTESCSLSRFDRAVFSGSRVHGEVAPADLDEIRPLSPREERSASNNSQDHLPRGHHHHEQGSQDGSSRTEDAASEEDAQEAPQSPTGSNASASSPTHVQFLEAVVEIPDTPPPETNQRNDSADGGTEIIGDVEAESHGQSSGPEGKFKRKLGDSDLASTHDPTRPLLFRQFLEAIVRLSLARFPHEQGLEAQIHRLFKEKLLPRSNEVPASEHLFECLVEREARQVLERHEPALWELFQDCATIGPAQLAKAVADAASDPTSGGRPEEPEYPYCAGPLGGPQRRLHVGARLDVTLRVKDVLKLLGNAGFLRPFQRGALPVDNSCGEVFDSDEYATETVGKLSEDEHGESADQEEEDERPGRANMRNSGFGEKTIARIETLKDYGSNTINSAALGFMKGSILDLPAGGGGGPAEFPLGDIPELPELQLEEPKDKRKRKDKEKESNEPELDAEGMPIPRPGDFVNCDFTVSTLQVLGVLAETMPPAHLPMVRWRCDPAVPGTTGREAWVSLLDYAESEVVFSEFQRLLVRVAELTSRRDGNLCAKFPASRRLEGFLQYVFLPSLRTPYAPPGERSQGAATSSGKSRPRKGSGSDAKSQQRAEADAEAGVDDEVADNSSRNQNLDEYVPFWHGFDVAAASSPAARAPRAWPAGYDQEVKDY
jgi:hypothetical protein